MALLGTSVLQTMYQDFMDTELTYSKEVATGLGALPAESTLRWENELFHCVIHSSNFRFAKILIRLTSPQWKALSYGTRTATLTLTFVNPKTAKKELFQFNGNLQVMQQHSGQEGERSMLLGVVFTHRPPEGFIEVQGSYLVLKREANQRKEERISLTNENRELLGLSSLNTTVTVDHIDRKCLLRDLSYNGARVILTGVAPFLVDKTFTLSVPLKEKAGISIPGKIVRAEAVEGHRGLAVIALGYHEDQVPVDYLRALQKGFKMSLGSRKPAAPSRSTGPQTSSIDMRTLKLVKKD
jgi:hypothetical protein